jgi:hypothetical protein
MDDHRIHWVSPSKQPDDLISLQQARQLVIERVPRSTVAKLVGDFFPTVGSIGEFVNMVYGGDRVKSTLVELATAEAIHTFACDWIGKHLATGALKFYRVEKRDQRIPIRGPLVVEESLREFWESSERDYRFLQKLILGRNEDPAQKWLYAVERATFIALLQVSFATGESEHATGDAPVVPPSSAQPDAKGSHQSNALKSPQAFVRELFIAEQIKGRMPTIVECERAWTKAGGRGHRADVREAAREELGKAGNCVRAGRPRNSPK